MLFGYPRGFSCFLRRLSRLPRKPLFFGLFTVFSLGGHHVSNEHRITDAHAKRDFRIFCIVIHRSLHTLQMQGAAVKTAAPHSAIFLSRSGVWRLWLLPYFGAERQIIVHRLMKLFLQALHVFGLKVHQIVDAEEPSEEDSILGGVFGPRRIPLYVIAACSIVQNRSLCVPVLDSSSKSSCSLYWYTNSQSGVMWHSRNPP